LLCIHTHQPHFLVSLNHHPPPKPKPKQLKGDDRCDRGLTCVISNERGVLGYASFAMYEALTGPPRGGGVSTAAAAAALLNSTAVMGACLKLTKADCGKLWCPCGAAAKKLGCEGAELQCKDATAYCASPGDTRMGGARCLPAPAGCGKVGGPCCPANMGGVVKERSLGGGDPVPYCGGGGNASEAMCLWLDGDYSLHGVSKFPLSPGARFFLVLTDCSGVCCVRAQIQTWDKDTTTNPTKTQPNHNTLKQARRPSPTTACLSAATAAAAASPRRKRAAGRASRAARR
jgi:hypothetical protein